MLRFQHRCLRPVSFARGASPLAVVTRALALLAASVALLAWPVAAGAAPVMVFAAVSLKDALDQQIRNYAAAGGPAVRAVYAGSNALARQIESGAPADVFIAADAQWMDYLVARGLMVSASRRDLLGNALVLVAAADNAAALTLTPGTAAATLLRALADGRLAMANPEHVPAGRYGRAALEALGAWTALQPRLARSENVRAALAFVARGEAPLGIVYRSDAQAEPRVKVVASFAPGSHAPIVYPAALVAGRDSAAARAFLDYLASDMAAPVWRQAGFLVKR